MKNNIPKKFQPAYNKIQNLQKYEKYTGAFIFGSIAREDSTDESDFDVIVIAERQEFCKSVNHPFIGGVKLDISFQTYGQFLESAKQEAIKAERIPIICESIIVFDKTGKLTRLKQRLQKIKPKKSTSNAHKFIQFMIYHADNKAERFLEKDPHSALLSMGININEILKFHYKLQGKWWVRNKRLLNDLREWDPSLAKLLEAFVSKYDVNKKFIVWSKIIDYVLQPIGGRLPISENNCTCNICREDLKLLN